MNNFISFSNEMIGLVGEGSAVAVVYPSVRLLTFSSWEFLIAPLEVD